MNNLVLLFLWTFPLWAQQALFVDLSGGWRESPGDQPAYARPDFDDSGWKIVQRPWQQQPPAGTFWLRRTVKVPDWAAKTPLALTIGPVSPVYELYVNGVRIAETNPFDDNRPVQPALSRIHDIPVASSRMTIAIRARDYDFGAQSLVIFRGGSYRLTDASQAHLNLDFDLLSQQRLRFVPAMTMSVMLFTFAALLGLLWLVAKGRSEPLWLGMLLAIRASFDWTNYHFLLPDAGPHSLFRLNPLIDAALVELSLVSVSLHSGWFRGLLWGIATFSAVFRDDGRPWFGACRGLRSAVRMVA